MIEEEPLMTLREVATLLHLHVNTLIRMTDRGDIACYRLGARGDRRFHPEDVRRYVREHRQPARTR